MRYGHKYTATSMVDSDMQRLHYAYMRVARLREIAGTEAEIEYAMLALESEARRLLERTDHIVDVAYHDDLVAQHEAWEAMENTP